MVTILVWYYITVGNGPEHNIVYSPPMPSEAACVHLQQSVPKVYDPVPVGRCVQITQLVTK